MKKILLLLFLCIGFGQAYCQNDSAVTDSLITVLRAQPEDSNKVKTLNRLARANGSSLKYATASLLLARKIKFKNGEASAHRTIGDYWRDEGNFVKSKSNYDNALQIYAAIKNQIGMYYANLWLAELYDQQDDYATALQYYFKALKVAERRADRKRTADVTMDIAFVYINQKNYAEGSKMTLEAKAIYEALKDQYGIAACNRGLGVIHYEQGFLKEALHYQALAYKIYKTLGDDYGILFYHFNVSQIYHTMAEKAIKAGNPAQGKGYLVIAEEKSHVALKMLLADKSINKIALGNIYIILGNIYLDLKQFEKARDYFEKCLKVSKSIGNKYETKNSYLGLTELDSLQGNYKQAFEHYKLHISYRDSMYNQDQEKQSLQHKMQYESEKKELQQKAEQDRKDVLAQKAKARQYTAIAILSVLFVAILVIVFIQWKNNKQKHRNNLILQQEKQKAESALSELKATQSQLIQSEKMASLGELTAGIAHEIQNPLNFVNNFSDVSMEMIEEIEVERQTENDKRDEKLIDEILTDIKQNLGKINHHGKRADAIVKGMLQHSRTNSGTKEPTDVNALADEYLRLAYHGLRAKDKSFNATLETDFDNSIEKVAVVPQDIGRVILNLITNAFHAVDEKKKSGLENYGPTVSVMTKKDGNSILISVKDNGNGIPDAIKDKIFQPFFTTKPTGEGTGLGLSLAYDIVKAHGGTLNVDSKTNYGTTFTIAIPIS